MWQQYIITTIHHHNKQCHHNNTSSQQYIITTIHHHNNTSPQQYKITTIHHHNNTWSQQYITTTIHHHNNTSPQQYIITTIHHHNNTSSQQSPQQDIITLRGDVLSPRTRPPVRKFLRHPPFSCTKRLPASTGGTPSVRQVRLWRFCVRFTPAIVRCTFKSVNEMIGCAVPMGLVILGCSLQCDGCIDLVDCRGGRRSCSVICKAVLADHSWIAASRWCLDLGNFTEPWVFSQKVAPGVDEGNLVCATGPAVTVLRSFLSCHCKLHFQVNQWDDWLRCANGFGDLELQFAA